MYLIVESTDKEFLMRLIDFLNKETVEPESTKLIVREGKYENDHATGRCLDTNVQGR